MPRCIFCQPILDPTTRMRASQGSADAATTVSMARACPACHAELDFGPCHRFGARSCARSPIGHRPWRAGRAGRVNLGSTWLRALKALRSASSLWWTIGRSSIQQRAEPSCYVDAASQPAKGFAPVDAARTKLMTAMDTFNHRFGRDSVRLWSTAAASSRAEIRVWAMKQERRPPWFTTRKDETPVVRA